MTRVIEPLSPAVKEVWDNMTPTSKAYGHEQCCKYLKEHPTAKSVRYTINGEAVMGIVR